MPWNPLYKSSWRTFLTALAARYGSNPAFVSISVAGPTASSEEMILPDNANTPAQDQFGGLLPNAMWLKLLAFHYPGRPAYQRSDQAFIDEWKAAIDMYGEIFSGVTLVATTGSGLPNLAAKGFTVPSDFSADCPNPNMDCAAETTILSYFEKPTVGGANAKAAQEDGMEAVAREPGTLQPGRSRHKTGVAEHGAVHGACGSDPRRGAVQLVLCKFHLDGRMHQQVSAQRRVTGQRRAAFRPPAPYKCAFPSRASRRLASPQASRRRIWPASRHSETFPRRT